MIIIALRGDDSCGKTKTLNLVYDRIIAAGGKSTNKVQLGGDPSDFEDIVRFKGLKVAFFTMGDYAYATIGAIRKYDGLQVDVLVIASNIKFVRPIALIITYSHNLVIKTMATPSSTTNDFAANTTDANIIFGLV